MTTTTRKTLETDKDVGERKAGWCPLGSGRGEIKQEP